MQKRTVTLVALVGLVAAAAGAYLVQRGPSGAVAADGKDASDARSAASTRAPSAPGKAAADDGVAKAAAKSGPGGPAPVEVIELKPTRVLEDIQAVGTLRANQSVLLRPEVTGRVAAIGFRDGQPVKQGQLLVGLDASLNEAEVAQARAELDLAQSNLKRTADLAQKNFVSGSAQEQAESNVEVLKARLQLAQARLAKMRIVAPFDGVAGIRSVNVGDVVRDGTDLVNIEDIGTLKADFRLPERYFTQLRIGLRVEVAADALPGATYGGGIEAINPRIDAGGRSLELRARLANTDGRLRPGMFARVRVILGDRPNALMVPEEAIVPLGADFYVFTVAGDVARRQRVKLGVRREGQVELLEGVQAGERVVTAGIRVQRDGQPVRVISTAGGQPAGGDTPAAFSGSKK